MFKSEYGELVICHDSPNCWRKDTFEYYKKSRKIKQAESKVDWNSIYKTLQVIQEEIKDNFPYINIKIPRTEADDIIFALCKEFQTTEKILILSNDKDFKQLQKWDNVYQYSITKKSFLVCEDPENDLIEHIIRGDTSDGIPNILSDSDTFVVSSKRQKRLTKNILSDISESIRITGNPPEYCQDNWDRNKFLIDLENVPIDLYKEIINQYNSTTHGTRNNMLNYMIENRLNNLIENLEDF